MNKVLSLLVCVSLMAFSVLEAQPTKHNHLKKRTKKKPFEPLIAN